MGSFPMTPPALKCTATEREQAPLCFDCQLHQAHYCASCIVLWICESVGTQPAGQGEF